MKLFLITLLLASCNNTNIKHVKLSGEDYSESPRNWENLYSKELDTALSNKDMDSFRFFWPYYLQERSFNKCKKYNIQHNISCYCQIYK